MERLIQSLHSVEEQTNNVISEVSQCLSEVENKAKGFISNLNDSLEHFLTTTVTNYYICGCGFETELK
jgi:hypothetical protein